MTSPDTPIISIARFAFSTTMPMLFSSFKHGITMDTSGAFA
jgi:hypothetical protein